MNGIGRPLREPHFVSVTQSQLQRASYLTCESTAVAWLQASGLSIVKAQTEGYLCARLAKNQVYTFMIYCPSAESCLQNCLLQLPGSDPMPGPTKYHTLSAVYQGCYWFLEVDYRACVLPKVLAVTDNRVSGQHLTEKFCLCLQACVL